jgi:anti-sigma regulatory factor (Ser/Thr protein kinase)
MQLQMLEVMTDSSKELLAKFDRLIERSYLEENSINKFMLLEDFNPDNLILELSSKYENLCFKKGLSFHFVQNHFNYDEKNIFVDGKKLRRILEELLDNAVKFTDTGDIWFEFNAQESFFDFSIQDSGSGINQEDIDRLSGSFSSSTRNILTRKTEGLGIGLSIVKDYTEILGGAVSFQKKKNGTLVSLKIPLALTMEKIWYYDLKKDFTKFSMQGFDTIGELNSYNTDLKGVMSYIKKQFEEYQSIDISSKKTFVTKALTDLLRLSKEKNLKTLEKITLQILSILKSDKDAYAYDLLDTLYKRINFSFSE